MKKQTFIYLLISTHFFQNCLNAQQQLNPTDYRPIPLPIYTPPLNANDRENKLVIYDMQTKSFDTLSGKTDYKPHKSGPSQTIEEFHKEIPSPLKRHEAVFTNLMPADQLPGFPAYPISTAVRLFLTF